MERVLLVMRDDGMRDALQHLWKGRYALTVCGCAEEARSLLGEKPDALVLDLFLPGEDGLTFLKKMASQKPPVVLVLTELFTEEISQDCIALDVYALFMKPCTLDALSRNLKEGLESLQQKSEKSPLP